MKTMNQAIRGPFVFSASSLEAFDRCPRRFWLYWVERLEWPAHPLSLQREKELHMRARFHRLLQQHYLGIEVAAIVAREPADSALCTWWRAFEQFPPPLPARPELFPEIVLTVPAAGHLLTARMDLLAVEPRARAVIVDWKTGGAPRREWAEQSWQSAVYRYVLAAAGAPYLGLEPVPPNRVEMVYWYAEYPASPLRLTYDEREHAAVEARLWDRIAHIASLPAEGFVATKEERECLSCAYRLYCGQVEAGEEAAGEVEEIEEPEEWDWSDIPEYEY